MDPGYRSPLVDFFRRGDTPRDARLLAARGGLPAAAHEQLSLLILLTADPDEEIARCADATLRALPRQPLEAFLARRDVPAEMTAFFAARGVLPAAEAAADAAEPLVPSADGDAADGKPGTSDAPQVLAGLPITAKLKLASKGTREQRAQLIRDPNRMVAAAVLSSPKLTDAEVEAFAKMANVSEEVLRVIGTNRTWLKNYGVVLGLVRNPKTPPAISMQLMHRLVERDVKMLSVDRNVPEVLRLAARKRAVKTLS